MTERTFDAEMQRAALADATGKSAANCWAELRLRCCYVEGHAGGHYDGRAENWLGLATRCSVERGGGHCWRAKDHRGEHEDEHGRTWRRRA